MSEIKKEENQKEVSQEEADQKLEGEKHPEADDKPTPKPEECYATGALFRRDNKVIVSASWHLSHGLTKDFQNQFLKLRCYAVQEVFGDLRGATGLITKEWVETARNELLKLRLNELLKELSSLSGPQEFVKREALKKVREAFPTDCALPIPTGLNSRRIYHPKSCMLTLCFSWPGIDDARWETIKEKFISLFQTLIENRPGGDGSCHDDGNLVQIIGKFGLFELGGN